MAFQGCPGSQSMSFKKTEGNSGDVNNRSIPSQLGHWPIQLHLISPLAPHYKDADVLLAADCTAFSVGNFHNDFIKGKSIAIACPKLDDGQEVYIDKIQAWVDNAKINTLTVVMMQVPCCGGLLHTAKQALKRASRTIPLKSIIIDLQGDILSEEWISVD